ncbi:MAG: 30S ribosomal protein S6 [Alphaproteobacteria bacterium]|nr:30S ribosomal protein S6 [Alphaproteobacteria bacterium]
MALYECVIIARQEMSSSQVESLGDAYASLIETQGGTVAKRENWGLKSLAHRMKKNRKGHYLLFNLDAPAAAVHELERNMRISEDVLRYLTLRIDAIPEGPSIMMQARTARDDRPGRRGEGFRSDGFRGDGFRGDRPPRGDDRRPANEELTEGGAP